MLKKLFIFVMLVLFLMTGTTAIMIYLIADENPLVASNENLKQEQLVAIREIIEQNRVSEVLQSNRKKVSLTASQLNQVMNYALTKIKPSARAFSQLKANRIDLNLSYPLPSVLEDKFLNIQSSVRIQHGKYFVIEQLKLGNIPVPKVAVTALQPYLVKEISRRYGDYVSLWHHLRRIDLMQDNVTVFYRLDRSDLKDVITKARRILINQKTRNQVIDYSKQLNVVLTGLTVQPHSLIKVLKPMFAYAAEQSKQSKNAVEENRMLLLVLGAYLAGKNPAALVSDTQVDALASRSLTLHNREDLAKHYVISAAINALSGTAWSNALGLEKEVKDSGNGSGFSFVDLMADIAGNKLAQVALNEKTASKVQEKFIQIAAESSLIGEIEGLAEDISEKEFRLEYGSVNSDEYISMIREIERRLYRCDAYRLR